jgi:hypothetical protein
MMRIKFTPAMLFAVTGSPTRPPTAINYSINAYSRDNLAGNAANKVFFNSVNGADSSTGNFLIAAAYKF